MSQREISAVARILTDPENSQRTGSEVAELVIEALAETVKTLRAEEVSQVADRVIQAVEGDRVDGIPARILDAIDERRSRTHRLAVVGQIQYGPQSATHTVVLGPFSARGILDTPAKFERAIEGGTAARNAGQHLAWDSKSGTGRGRFMLVPAFRRPQDAWDFYRGPAKRDSEPMNLLVPPPRHIAEAIARWKPGLWAEENETPRP